MQYNYAHIHTQVKQQEREYIELAVAKYLSNPNNSITVIPIGLCNPELLPVSTIHIEE